MHREQDAATPMPRRAQHTTPVAGWRGGAGGGPICAIAFAAYDHEADEPGSSVRVVG